MIIKSEKYRGGKKDYWIVLGLVAVTLMAYWNVPRCDFINYDDGLYVVDNPHVTTGLLYKNIVWAFTNMHYMHWFPLTWLSHMLVCQYFGLDPVVPHLLNLLLHVCNVCLVFFVLNKMTGECWKSAFVAALFAVHPLNVESVAWISERSSVLSTFFWILTIGAYVRYAQNLSWRRYLVVLLIFALGIMAKPQVVTLPCVLLLLDYWPLKRWGDTPNGAVLLSPWRIIADKIPLFALSVVCCFLTLITQVHIRALPGLQELPLNWRLGNVVVSYAAYIAKMIYPIHLSVFYPYPDGGLPTWAVVGAGLLLAGITLWMFRVSRAKPYLVVGWLWYAGTLFPMIGLIQGGSHAMADRYAYLPMIGLFIGSVWGIANVWERLHWSRVMLGMLSAAAVAICTVLAFIQVGYWRNSVTLFEHAVAVTDNNYVAHNNLAFALIGKGELDQAIAHLREAVRIKPACKESYNGLGYALVLKGDLRGAMAHYSKQPDGSVDLSFGHESVAQILEGQGQTAAAAEHYKEALRIKPDYAQAHYNYGNLLYKVGNVSESIMHYRKAMESDPHNVNFLNNLGMALAREGKTEEAMTLYRRALTLNPRYDMAYYNLGLIFARQGRFADAIANLSRAYWLNPTNREACFNMGVVLFRQGDAKGARGYYLKALKIDPDYVEAAAALEMVKER